MEKSITVYVIVAISCFALFCLLGFGSMLLAHWGWNPEVRIPAKYAPYGLVGIFILFLVFGFSLIPIMLRLFFKGQTAIERQTIPMAQSLNYSERSVNSYLGVMSFLRTHETHVVYAFWAFYLVGLVIAVPAMVKDGFFTPQNSPRAERERAPGALPPLAYQIDASVVIVMAETLIQQEKVLYRPLETIKAPPTGSPFVLNQPLEVAIQTWQALGYIPRAGEQVVLLFSADGLRERSPLEILPVVDGQMTYGAADSTVTETVTLDEFKSRVHP